MDKMTPQMLEKLTLSQTREWPLAAVNFKGLEKVEEKSFEFDGFKIIAQFNPERIRSSVAGVDKKSIAARPCFLCGSNRPKEQRAVPFDSDFSILINPYPIFRNHFTIVNNLHVDQRFIPYARTFLQLAASMEDYTILYNGPECGASAPDHMHFQACESCFLPVNAEFDKLRKTGTLLFKSDKSQVWAFDTYLREMISIESESVDEALKFVNCYYRFFSAMQPEKVEPMMNALCSFRKEKWVIHLFPRKAHRPDYFFETGEKQLLMSPGSVDFAGVFIFPRREDFDKITKELIVDILNQVCLNQDDFVKLTDKLKSSF
jgi:hypothetical protein